MAARYARYTTISAKFDALTQPTEDGHITWTGPVDARGLPLMIWQQKHMSPARFAFTRHHGREPDGRVIPVCDHRHCLAGAHLGDASARRRLAVAYAALGLR